MNIKEPKNVYDYDSQWRLTRPLGGVNSSRMEEEVTELIEKQNNNQVVQQ